MRYLSFFLSVLLAMPAHATQFASAEVCEISISGERIDSEAQKLVTSVHNRLAARFEKLQEKAEEEGMDTDVTFDFNAERGLPVAHSQSNSDLILVDIEDNESPLSYGLPSRLIKDSEKVVAEQTQRSQTLARLGTLAEAISDISASGGDSQAEFARVYRGREQIAGFLSGLGQMMKDQLGDQRKVEKGLEFLVDRFDDYDFLDVSDYLRPILRKIPRYQAGPVGTWISYFLLNTHMWVNDMIAYLTQNFLDRRIDVIQTVNSFAAQYNTHVDPLVIYTVPLVVWAAYLWKTHNGESYLDPASQFFLMMTSMDDIAQGRSQLSPSDLIHWSTKYSYRSRADEDGYRETYKMRFDLILIQDQGEPVLVVVNREANI